jgi:alkylhydroperoxidase family enzyme
MPRVKQIRTVDDYPHELGTDEQRAQLASAFERFETMAKRWAGPYAGATTVPNSWAQIFHVPRFGELVLELADFVLNDLPWAQRMKLRELAILTLYERQRCDYGYRAHLGPAIAAGITEEQIAELPVYRTSEAFDDEERDVIDFTNASFDGHVSDELFERLKARYGEQQMVEMTAVVAFWALWGIVITTLQPEYVPVH